MEKIYGYKEEDVLGLAQMVKNKGNTPLSKIFEKYKEQSGKAKGTVRNLYYALAKHSNINSEFCNKYLDGKPLKVYKIKGFNRGEERELVEKVLIAKSQGRSCRSTILELANGDSKLALRYQNKYRNAIKNNPVLVEEIIEELKNKGVKFESELHSTNNYVSDAVITRFKNEINSSIDKNVIKIKNENRVLRERVGFLERENLKLVKILYGDNLNTTAVKFFGGANGQDVLN